MFDSIADVQRMAELMARQVINDLNPEETQELHHWKARTGKHNAIFCELTDVNKIVAHWEHKMLI